MEEVMLSGEQSDADRVDTLLMLRVRDHRDEVALRELIQRYQKPIYSLAYRMLNQDSEAEDLAQRTFIRVWKAAPTYEPSAKFSTWIFTILRHLVLNEARRRSRKPSGSLEAVQELGLSQADTPQNSPTALISQKELEQQVEAALAQLSPNARLAIQLRRFEGKSYEEIAEILGLSLSATKSIIFRARQELRQILAAFLR